MAGGGWSEGGEVGAAFVHAALLHPLLHLPQHYRTGWGVGDRRQQPLLLPLLQGSGTTQVKCR